MPASGQIQQVKRKKQQPFCCNSDFLRQPTAVHTIRRCSEIRRSETRHIRIQNTRAGLTKFDVMEVMQLLLNIQKVELSCR